MKKITFALLLVVFSHVAVANDFELRKNKYDSGLLPLGTGYQAKLFCSCIFVMKRTENYCKKFVTVSPAIFKITANMETKTVEARALYFFAKSTAKWRNKETGCLLEP
jgi:hypothetical protein